MPYDGTINTQHYRDILQNKFVPSIQQLDFQSGYLFQQALAKLHTARTTKAWFQQYGILVLDCILNSPDIDHINDLWR